MASSSSNHLKNIAVVGASGNIGSYIVSALLAKRCFNVNAISRIESKATFANGVTVTKVDYNKPDTVVEALKGQDVLIITMSAFAHDAQPKLIRAAADAGVPWVLPNEFGMYNTEEAQNDTIGSSKTKAKELIESLGVSSWLGVTCGFWYEYSLSGGSYGIDVAKREAVFFDKGTQRLNTSTWPQVGRAVASLISLPVSSLDAYRNRMLYISSFALSQRDMLKAVQRATGTTDSDWKITSEPTKQRYADAKEKMKSGDHSAFVKALYTRYFIDEEGLYEKTHELANEKLGLPEEDLEEATKAAVELQKSGYWN
ncbi:NAD(P)-binding protein [Clathrospora elynae]|uniref:NAD(P)-binding protein n=1 Tax=Clathrospora elynae TaxID=706981 RepID=A0A6A5T0N4_9PLEO|nr:NAD(P)-binding protein [Clathrospora elynae]